MLEVLTPLQRFWRLLSLHTKEIYQIYAYAVLNGFVNLSLPLGIQSIINYIQTGQITFSWGVLVVFVLLGIAVTGILQVLQLRIVENIQHAIFMRSSLEFAYRIPKMKLRNLDNNHIPELVNRFFDTINIQKGIPKILIDFSLAIFQIFFGLTLLAFYSPYFIFIGIILVLAVWIILKLSGREGLEYSLKESKMKYDIAHWLEEIASNNKSFKFYSDRNYHIHKTDKLVVKYLEARESHFQVLLKQFKQFIGLKIFLAAGLLVAGSLLVLNEELNIGQFVAAEIIIILIINSIEKVIRVVDTIYDVLTGLEKIGAVTDVPLEESSGTYEPVLTTGAEVELNNFKFQYPDTNLPIITIDNYVFKKNTMTVLSGPTGNGKTTLLNLIGGLYEVQQGELLFNGVPLSNYTADFIHNSIGYVFSTNELFNGTIWENITFGYEADEEYIYELIKVFNLQQFIAKRNKGLHARIDSEGRRLPRSVIQKILMIRALVHKPKLLLLDSPLVDVSIEDRKQIMNWLFSDKIECTIIASTNDKFWLDQAHQIIEL